MALTKKDIALERIRSAMSKNGLDDEQLDEDGEILLNHIFNCFDSNTIEKLATHIEEEYDLELEDDEEEEEFEDDNLIE